MLQRNIVKKYINSYLNQDNIKVKYEKYKSTFHNPEKIQHIKESKEEQYQEGFLRDLFCDILGYTINPEPNFNLITEKKNESDSRKADGAIIIDGKVQAIIELKGCDTTDLSKVENQAFGYKAHNPTANLVIISNFEKLRLYIEDASNFLVFNIFTMTYEQFELLYLCLSLENVKSCIALKLKKESISSETSITDKLYADYSAFKRDLFEDICNNNLVGEGFPLASKAETAFSATPSSGDTPQRPAIDKLTLFKKTQKLLDRILFVLFSEDRGLLPENSIAKIIDQWQKLKELDAYQPLYNRFKNYFDHINTGYKSETDPNYVIFAYNGGLFKPDEILDNIKISDEVLYIHTKKLYEYDYESEVSVDILGHIFEHSLTEIEEIQEEIKNEKSGINTKISKRKKDGVFYTPAYITKYIVENTIGKLCEDKKTELGINDETFAEKRRNKNQKAELEQKLKTYREWLLQLKICDPACGSGAFLNAALQFLKAEHALVDELTAKLYGDTLIFQEVENTILENNLYGVDINEESVEIAKLSLWLHTAQKGRKLSTLNNNIKCGNSLIDDPEIAGEKAFCWEKEFPEVFGVEDCHTDSELLRNSKGFDVVIGNPPYGAKIEKREIEYISSRYKDCGISTSLNDTYFCFYALCLKYILKDKGILGFISPNTWKLIDNAKLFRKYLFNQKFSILEIVQHLNKVFEDATVDCDTLIIQKHGINNSIKICFLDKDKIKFTHTLLQSKLSEQEYINLFLTDTDYSLKEKIIHNSVFVKDELIIKNGVKPYEKGKGKPAQTSEILKNKPFTSETKIDDTFSPLIGGSSFHKYKLLWNNDYWIKYGEWLAAPREKNIFEAKEKLIFRQTSDCLIGTYISSGFIMRNNTHILLEKENSNLNLKYVLSILNSKLLDWYYWTINPEHGEALAEVKAFHLGLLPIKVISKENQQPFIELADKMLSLNADLQKSTQRFIKRVKENLNPAKISSALESFYTMEFSDFVKELAKQKVKLSLKQQDEWEEYFAEYKENCVLLQEQINTTDAEINQLVYKLYDLTEEEISAVEGK